MYLNLASPKIKTSEKSHTYSQFCHHHTGLRRSRTFIANFATTAPDFGEVEHL